VREEEVFGFLGPNGAGKSTTIRLVMDTIRPTRGAARVLGRDAHSESVSIKRDVGYLPGEIPDFGTLRGSEVVGYMAGLRRISPARRVAELCERLDIDLAQRFRDYSRGNKQKIGVVLAFMHDPRLLILDEPTSGLDPLVQQEFYGLVRAARERGATVFLSSHVLSEVEHICERAAIVRAARLVQVVELTELHHLRLHHVEIEFSGDPPARRLQTIAGVEDVGIDGNTIRCSLRGSFEPLIDALSGAGVVNLTSHEPTLEETFLSFYRSAKSPES
jgi:ABC-2 type transport system ATP-binding protein